ncbi:MAG TPA: helix-turn-helix transcriptional regulator [Ktedonosporobacter sp.]|nr:helix-turn-helix transcriptional regulator [Ktedonosporobacter sp.]
MAERKERPSELSDNAFGKLVKSYREQRGWSQGELAERWGHSREYVSMVERGKRKVDSTAQIVRLADILDIPSEKLEAIGRGIPTRKMKPQSPAQSDNALLQMLLAPGRDMVRLSWLAWYADAAPDIEDHLHSLVLNLDQALTLYRGEFVKPAQQLLAYAHQMLGKIAFDRLDYAAAGGHFSEMVDLGQELNDADMIAVGMVHQGSLLRKRGRYETAFRCFEAARPFSEIASPSIQGLRYLFMARGYYDSGDEQQFLRTINSALDIAAHTKDTMSSLANQFSLDDVLCEQASGFSELWKPEKALEIYKETDRTRPFRPLREQGSYIINKAQAYLHLGDVEQGIQHALKGIELASEYRSKRQILWLDKTYNRLRVTPLGKDKRLYPLRDALREAQRAQADW